VHLLRKREGNLFRLAFSANLFGRNLIEPRLVNFCVVVSGFLLLSLLSYTDRLVALQICTAAIISLGIVSAELTWALTIFLMPFGEFFAFDVYDTRFLVAVALATSFLKLAPRVSTVSSPIGKWIPSCSWMLVSFIGLVMLHFNASNIFREAQAAALMGCAYVFFIAARLVPSMSRRVFHLIEFAFCAGAIVSAMLSAIFLYAPLPQLIMAHLPVDNLRLTGVQDGSNSTARYLIPAAGCAISHLLLDIEKRKGLWLWGVLLVAVVVLMAATKSKGSIVALLVMCLLVMLLVPSRLRTIAMLVFLVVPSSLVVWLAVAQPRIDYRAAQIWSSAGSRNLDYYLDTPPGSIGSIASLKQELRIGVSSRMHMSPDGKILYEKRSDDVWKTGQRDLLWNAGLDVLAANVLWGIGFDAWREEMQRRLGFPFASPHNGLLETAGAFGIIGGLLYGLLAIFLLKSLFHVRRHLAQQPATPAFLWPVLSIASLLVIELVDVSTILAPVLFAVWSWTLLGLHEGLLALSASDEQPTGTTLTKEAKELQNMKN
jgi:O-antigen ligase